MSKHGIKNSRLQVGWVRHRRFSPKSHALKYPVFMWYLDLDELGAINQASKLFSLERWNWISYQRNDFFNSNTTSLKQAVIDKMADGDSTIASRISRVCMLTNLRTFGFIMNPVTFYYAFDSNDHLIAIMPEITNTPWNEKHQYVLSSDESSQIGTQAHSVIRGRFRYKLDKSFHISPFHPMNVQYDWRLSEPTQKTNLIHLENWQKGKKVFDATMSLRPALVTAQEIRKTLIRFPLMTVKVASGIYWNALKLWIKGVPFYSHPNKSNKEKTL
jgi:DUF1365 family protein